MGFLSKVLGRPQVPRVWERMWLLVVDAELWPYPAPQSDAGHLLGGQAPASGAGILSSVQSL